MSPTEERLQALLDKWVASLEAHLRYCALSEEAYWQVQSWAPHQRPNRWIVELALSRATELRRELAARREAGDEAFAGAMEQMSFLANLVGSENIARFIPLADPASERAVAAVAPAEPAKPPSPAPAVPPVTTPSRAVRSLLDDPSGVTPALEVTREMPRAGTGVETSPTRDMPRPELAAGTSATREMPRPELAAGTSETREMPRPELTAETSSTRQMRRPEVAGETSSTRQMPRPTGAKRDSPATRVIPRQKVPAPLAEAVSPPAAEPAATKAAAKALAPVPAAPEPVAAEASGSVGDELVNIVIADAIRLRKWGREWHELANTIARMAGRPELSEIRRILRTHKADIEAGTPRRTPPTAS